MSQMYLPLAEGCRLAQEISVEIAHKKQTSRIQFRLDSSKKKKHGFYFCSVQIQGTVHSTESDFYLFNFVLPNSIGCLCVTVSLLSTLLFIDFFVGNNVRS